MIGVAAEFVEGTISEQPAYLKINLTVPGIAEGAAKNDRPEKGLHQDGRADVGGQV